MQDLKSSAPLFAALGDETRLSIVTRLCEGLPLSINALTKDSKISRQAINKHLLVLSEAGLVQDRWRGRNRIWEVNPGRLSDVTQSLAEISKRWDRALGRLKILVEE